MGKVYFVFGIHNHQPVGNFDHVFGEAYERCYYPFLSILEKFPRLKCAIHNSGPLYDWFSTNRPEYINILKKLAKRGQVEIISGGYYEPILPVVSNEDRIGQIEMMNKFIKKEFETKPKGIWTAERVWEPYLAKLINNCGLQYTFLDDTHFRYAGCNEKEFFDYYTTEEEGYPVFIFPISKALRYKIPFSQAHEAVNLLQSFAQDGDVLVTLFDDGEKFGLWPHTYEWVYEKMWLHNFFSLIEKSSNIITITPEEAVNKFSSRGIIYIPTASYEEMGEWVLEPEAFSIYDNLKDFLKEKGVFDTFKDFMRGGFFRNFYRKYPRLNYMHKRMLNLSKKINAKTIFNKDKDIFVSLWKAQTNCGYWHGIFGGFYLGHIRYAVYENLLAAENLFDEKYSKKSIDVEEEDIDLDGRNEVIVKNKNILCCFSKQGGSILELSLRKSKFNLLNTITRREESYHRKIKNDVTQKNTFNTIHDGIVMKEKGLEKLLIYDKYERLSLMEHLVDKNFTIDNFNTQEGIATLSKNIYDLSIKKNKNKVELNYEYKTTDLSFLKKIEFNSSSCGFDTIYTFSRKNILNNYNFAIEFNLALPSSVDIFKEERTKRVPLNKPGIWEKVNAFTIIYPYKKLILVFKFDKADVFSFPLYSVSSSESGFEKVYQQVVILFMIREIKDSFKLLFKAENVESSINADSRKSNADGRR